MANSKRMPEAGLRFQKRLAAQLQRAAPTGAARCNGQNAEYVYVTEQRRKAWAITVCYALSAIELHPQLTRQEFLTLCGFTAEEITRHSAEKLQSERKQGTINLVASWENNTSEPSTSSTSPNPLPTPATTSAGPMTDGRTTDCANTSADRGPKSVPPPHGAAQSSP